MQQVKTILDTINHFRKLTPVDVEGLAIALGITVKKVFLADNISGFLKKISNDEFIIGVNESHSETRQRFTIAHELGHFVLHRHLIGDGITDNLAYRADGKTGNPNIGSVEETAANRFAANLLMPEEAIIQLKANGIKSPREMAKMLKVSERAMEIRLGC